MQTGNQRHVDVQLLGTRLEYLQCVDPFGNLTQTQIANEVGISQMHVSRLLSRTLAALREQIEAKAHWSAVTDDYLTKEFRKARDLAKAYDHIENPKARPTMHELRALGAWLYEQQGFSTEYVQALLGHATPEMTAYYQDGHAQKEVIYQHVQAGLKL